MKSGVELISDERKRQVSVKKYDAQHDDRHGDASLATCAAMVADPFPVWRYHVEEEPASAT